MKKTILAALAALTLAVAVHADDKQLWADYTAAKTASKAALAVLEDGNTTTAAMETAVAAFAKTGAAAKALNRSDIEAWTLNNSAYAQITWFKNAGYAESTKSLEGMKPSKEKFAAIKATRELLKPLFEQIEASAKASLAAAEAIGPDNEDFIGVVKSNKGFIKWVHQFVNGN